MRDQDREIHEDGCNVLYGRCNCSFSGNVLPPEIEYVRPPSRAALLALVQQWREEARSLGHEDVGRCADQLERLITGEGKP